MKNGDKHGTPILDTRGFLDMVQRSSKASLPDVPSKEILKNIDPMGTHVIYRALLHGDGEFIRTWWYVKFVGNTEHEPVSVQFDMLMADFNLVPRVRMNDKGEWEVVIDD